MVGPREGGEKDMAALGVGDRERRGGLRTGWGMGWAGRAVGRVGARHWAGGGCC